MTTDLESTIRACAKEQRTTYAVGGGAMSVSGVLLFVLALFDAAHRESPPSLRVLVPHWDVLLTAVTAKVDVVEISAAVTRDELLAVQSHRSLTGGL